MAAASSQAAFPKTAIGLIEGLALQTPPRSAASIHRQVTAITKEQGWNPSSYARVRQIIKKLDPALVTPAHQGAAAYREEFDLLYRREATHANDQFPYKPFATPGSPAFTEVLPCRTVYYTAPVTATVSRIEREVMALQATLSYLVEAVEQASRGKDDFLMAYRLPKRTELVIVDEAQRLKTTGLEQIGVKGSKPENGTRRRRRKKAVWKGGRSDGWDWERLTVRSKTIIALSFEQGHDRGAGALVGSCEGEARRKARRAGYTRQGGSCEPSFSKAQADSTSAAAPTNEARCDPAGDRTASPNDAPSSGIIHAAAQSQYSPL